MSTTFRVHKNKNYTVMSNYHLSDVNLSLKAVGLMSKMLSLPDDWDYSINGLAAISKDGVKSVRSALKELEENGYLVRTRINGEGGKYIYNYDIYECPIQVAKDEPYTQKGNAVPYTQKGHAVKGAQLNTNKLNTNNINNNNNNINNIGDSSEPDDNVVVVQKMAKEYGLKIKAKDAIAILKVSDNNLTRVKKALDVLSEQKKKITNITGWLITAIIDDYELAKKPYDLTNKFHNFEERKNDYDELERRLLGY